MLCPIVELAMKLIRCPSISPNDAGCQDIIIEHLQSVGFTIEYMNFGDTKNFWAWHGKGETLLFSGHTDVISVGDEQKWDNPPFKPTILDGILFGRGSSDMKGSLAAMVIAAEHFVTLHPHHKGRLAFLITSDEESSAKNGTMKVIETLIARNERIDYCLIGEPTSTKIVGDVIKNGRRGSLTCDLIVHGTQGHVAYPHLASNPIHLAIPMLNELVSIKLLDQRNESLSLNDIQITNIQAGTGNNNVIPDNLFVQFNFRFNAELTESVIKARVIEILQKYQFQYTVNWCLSGKPFLTKQGKLIDVVVDAIAYCNKITAQLATTGGTSDGRFIAKTGAQIVELGLINNTIHKMNEYVSIADLQLLSRIYQRIMRKILLNLKDK